MGDRLHRRRRPQPVTMEADAEAAFPAPPDDVTQQQQQQQQQQQPETTHRRRRPIRADHDANMEAMYNHHAQRQRHLTSTATGRRRPMFELGQEAETV